MLIQNTVIMSREHNASPDTARESQSPWLLVYPRPYNRTKRNHNVFPSLSLSTYGLECFYFRFLSVWVNRQAISKNRVSGMEAFTCIYRPWKPPQPHHFLFPVHHGEPYQCRDKTTLHSPPRSRTAGEHRTGNPRKQLSKSNSRKTLDRKHHQYCQDLQQAETDWYISPKPEASWVGLPYLDR